MTVPVCDVCTFNFFKSRIKRVRTNKNDVVLIFIESEKEGKEKRKRKKRNETNKASKQANNQITKQTKLNEEM